MNILFEKGYIDLTKVLLENYVKLGLDEKELVFILQLINVQKDAKTTTEMFEKIATMTTFSSADCEKMAGTLMDYGLMDMEFVDNRELCDFSPIIDMLYKTNEVAESDIIGLLEEALDRQLTKYELDDVDSWIAAKYTINEIKNGIDKAKMEHKLTVKYVDAIISGRLEGIISSKKIK